MKNKKTDEGCDGKCAPNECVCSALEKEESDFYISQEDFNEIMEENDAEMKKIGEEDSRINKRILNAILKTKGIDFYNDLIAIIEDCQIHSAFEITNHPEGNYQSEGYKTIKGYWVSQMQSGESGDSFYGSISIKIKENKFIQMFFAS